MLSWKRFVQVMWPLDGSTLDPELANTQTHYLDQCGKNTHIKY